MKRYTQQQALKEIFSQSHLSTTMRVLKFRWQRGTISTRSIESILEVNNFVPTRPILYKKKK